MKSCRLSESESEYNLGAGGSGVYNVFCPPVTGGTIAFSGGITPFTSITPGEDPLTVICNSNGTVDVIYRGAVVAEATDVVITCA